VYKLVGTVPGVDSRERLIGSAQELLWERGYIGTSPRAIQERARVGQGSMYHHFEGKPDLAATAVRRHAEDLRAETEPLLDGPGSPLTRIEGYLRRERDTLRGCRIGGLTQDPEVVARPELRVPLQDTFDWLSGRIAQLVSEAQAAGELDRTLDPEATAGSIAAVVQGGYVLARAAQSDEAFAHAVDGLLGLLETARTG
jgi:TetR/AcrR family transcriptional repressor of nem operon